MTRLVSSCIECLDGVKLVLSKKVRASCNFISNAHRVAKPMYSQAKP